MAKLAADQRNYYYLLDAERSGIHKPILAALYAAHQSPVLRDGETGLGISPANRIPPEILQSFPGQTQYAANTIRSLTNVLTAKGWRGTELWSPEQGRYTDRFLQEVANGYTPALNDVGAALLESTDMETLKAAYLADIAQSFPADQLPQNLAYLDGALLTFAERVPRYYAGFVQQRDSLVEAFRLWRKLDTRQMAINFLREMPPHTPLTEPVDETVLDRGLMLFAQNVSRYYGGYPHQREALIRLVQFWRQLDSREEAIALLQKTNSAETDLAIVDPALIAFIQRIPIYYRGQGDQRNALTECFRLWRRLDSRASALTAMGIDPQFLQPNQGNPETLLSVAAQLDRELLNFAKRVPLSYQEEDFQREALIRLVQLWRGLESRNVTLKALMDDVRRMQRAQPNSPDAVPAPVPQPLPPRPSRWTPDNLQLYAAIIPNGIFTWADATHGGTRMPPNQSTVDAIVRIATLAQDACNRIGRPFRVTSWYRTPALNAQVGGASLSRHVVGDAIDFYCEGLTGDQLYWALDPWWTGGLGRYTQYPYLCHIDARGYRSRWLH
jgi:hypothetical protein